MFLVKSHTRTANNTGSDPDSHREIGTQALQVARRCSLMTSSAARILLGGIFIGSRSTKVVCFHSVSFASSVFDDEKSRTNASDVIATSSPASPKFDPRVQGFVNEREGI